MKSLNGKRIAAVAAGAALLGLGLAFAGPVSFQSVPIISNSGQPVVQVVIGSTAKPSDGAAAANIAAAIGNLAYTSVPVTATVNMTQASKVLHAVLPSNAGYSLSNVGVYLNESSTAYVSGTYSFGALIGSVLNKGVLSTSSSPTNTKSLSGSSYGYPEQYVVSSSYTSDGNAPSPYVSVPGVPINSTAYPSAAGGVTFTSFASGNYDNILQVSSSQLPALMNAAGQYKESEYLWLSGFPVYSQSSGVNNFELLSAGGAYQLVFGSEVPMYTSANAINNTASFNMLGQNWTVIGYKHPPISATLTSGSNTVAGNSNTVVELASSLSNLTTLYVGQNITSGPFRVELTDLGQPNQNAVSAAAFNIYYNNVLTNVTSILPNDTPQQFNVTGHLLYVKVKSTFAGLYAYEKYAKVQLYSNVFNLTEGGQFSSSNKGWTTDLFFGNVSGTGTRVDGLQSIVIYNTSPTTNLQPGQSFSFITSPSVYKLTFVGQTLGSANYDTISFSTKSVGSVRYKNPSSTPGPNINVTEPAQELIMSSQIPNAFSYTGGQGSTVTFDLTPYEFTQGVNQPTPGAVNVIITGVEGGNFISSSTPLTVVIKGYSAQGSAGKLVTSPTLTFTSNSAEVETPSGFNFYNITSINVTSRALPGLTMNAVWTSNTANVLGTLAPATTSPAILYTSSSGLTQLEPASASNNNYNNGVESTAYALSAAPSVSSLSTTSIGLHQYATFNVIETAVPSVSSSYDEIGFGIDNSTNPASSNIFTLNNTISGTTSAGVGNNITYYGTGYSNGVATQPDTGNAIKASSGFYTERGSKVGPMTATTLSLDMAKSIDELLFSVGPSSTTGVVSNVATKGPFSIGQSTNIPNVSIAKVAANITVSSSSGATVSGISNLTATPSVSVATTPVLLNNLPTSPLVVLDSAANPSSNLILVGSGYVNTLSQQLETSQGISITPTSAPITQAYGTNRILVAGYTANQTTAAANTFIQDLYANAASST
jgi:hypothetical protein